MYVTGFRKRGELEICSVEAGQKKFLFLLVGSIWAFPLPSC